VKDAGLITRALAEKTPARMLRAFIEGMSARKDVRVREKKVGGPAPAALLRAKRGVLPDDLLDFFAEMNGATFRFTMIPDDSPIDGFELDPLEERTQFREREEVVQDGHGTGVYLSDFGGPDVLHLLLDNIRNERPVHYVKTRKAAPKAAKIVYSPEVDRPPMVDVAKSFAGYVRLGISRAFAHDWPRSAAGKKIAARLDTPERAPTGLAPGARVVSKRPQCCSPNRRATVVQLDTAAKIPARLTGKFGSWTFGNELVLLKFDQGPTERRSPWRGSVSAATRCPCARISRSPTRHPACAPCCRGRRAPWPPRSSSTFWRRGSQNPTTFRRASRLNPTERSTRSHDPVGSPSARSSPSRPAGWRSGSGGSSTSRA
jgi:hypothetical protein